MENKHIQINILINKELINELNYTTTIKENCLIPELALLSRFISKEIYLLKEKYDEKEYALIMEEKFKDVGFSVDHIAFELIDYISQKQITELNEILDFFKPDIKDQLLKYYKIKNLSELKESDFFPTIKKLTEMKKYQKLYKKENNMENK